MTDRSHDPEPPRIEQAPPETRNSERDGRTLGDRATDRMAESRNGEGGSLRPSAEFQRGLDDFKVEKAARQEASGEEGRLPEGRDYLQPSPEFQRGLDDFKVEKAARQEAAVDDPPERDARVYAPSEDNDSEPDGAPPEAARAMPTANGGERSDGSPPDAPGDGGPPPPPPDASGAGGPPDRPPTRDDGDDGQRRPPGIEDVIAGLEPPDTRNTQRYLDAKEASESPLIDEGQLSASLLGNVDVDSLSTAARDTYDDLAEQIGRMDVAGKSDAVFDQARVNVYEAANTVLQHADISDLQTISEALSDRSIAPSDVAAVTLVVLKCYVDRLANGGR